MDNTTILPVRRRRMANYVNTPPGGWVFRVPETGKTIGPFTGWIQLKDQLAGHYHAAGYPVPDNLFQLVEDQICEAQPEYCGAPATENPVAKLYKETKHTFHAAIQCLSTLVSHRAGSGEKPPLEQQEARAQVCVKCPENTDITPCSVCSFKQLGNLIKKLVGAKTTSVDSQLKFCGVCHCANAAKVATKHDAIWTHMPQKQRDQLPIKGMNGSEITCWLVVEQEEKDAKYDVAR